MTVAAAGASPLGFGIDNPAGRRLAALLTVIEHLAGLVLAETVARDLLVHGRVLSPIERIATTMAIGETELQQAARDLLSQPPTLCLSATQWAWVLLLKPPTSYPSASRRMWMLELRPLREFLSS